MVCLLINWSQSFCLITPALWMHSWLTVVTERFVADVDHLVRVIKILDLIRKDIFKKVMKWYIDVGLVAAG